MQITCDGGLTFCIYTGGLFVCVADCCRLSELVYFGSSYSREMNGSHFPPPLPPSAPSDYIQVRFWCIRFEISSVSTCFFFVLFPPNHFISANGVFAEAFCLLGVITVEAWGIISIDENESGYKKHNAVLYTGQMAKASRKYFTITSCDQLKRG